VIDNAGEIRVLVVDTDPLVVPAVTDFAIEWVHSKVAPAS
jgi:hypothetical protein